MAKPKNPATQGRVYSRVYICMKCCARIRADAQKVIQKKIKCRKCGYRGLRPKSKERKV